MLKQAVFLVGGKGTRLGSITQSLPKPLLNVGGRPFLDYLIDNVARHGITRILLLAGHLGEEIVNYSRGFNRAGLELTCIVESIHGGTAGGLRLCRDRLDETFLLCNGDSFLDFNILDLAIPARNTDRWLAQIGLRRVDDASKYGAVTLSGGNLVEFQEKAREGPGIVNAGVYAVKRELVEKLTDDLPCSLENDVVPGLAREGLLLGKVYDGYFIDIGTPADFERAKLGFVASLKRPAVFLDRDGVLNVDYGHVHRAEDVTWIPGAREAVKLLNDAGFCVFVVTNQAGIAKRLYSLQAMHDVHEWMQSQLAQVGGHVDAFYFCPHHPTEGIAPFRKLCECRKPKPGMLRAAFDEWPADADKSILIGDKLSDVEAGGAVGVDSFLFKGGNLYEFANEILRARGLNPH